jgi:hypothetical protein
MNKLITNINGGFPLTLDDIRWNDDAYRFAFANLLKAYAPSNNKFIISGVVATPQVSPEGYNVSAGLIYFNGEILQVDAHFVAYSGNALHQYIIRKSITYDPAGNVPFEDTVAHDTWQINRGVCVHVMAIVGEMSLFAMRLEDLIFLNISSRQSAWLTPTFENGWQTQSGLLTNYKKDAFNWVHIRGFVENASSNTNTIFTLPDGFRPVQAYSFPSLDAVAGVAGIMISTAGLVRCKFSAQQVILDGISFKID